jgi:hypothetical protein
MRVPRQFVKTVADFKICFVRHALIQSIPEAEALRLFEMLPFELRQSDCFEDALTGLWRYDFGTPPITLPGGGQIVGTPHFQEVRVLVRVIYLACRVLQNDRLSQYIHRLANKEQHPDVLAEFQPLQHRVNLRGIENEAAGVGNKTIDWLIPDDGQPPLYVEVKSRIRDLIESFESLHFAQSLGIDEIPAPHHDPALMMRSTTDKFPSRDSSAALHCLWIAAHLKQEANETRRAFGQLEAGRIHVVVFGGWTKEASLIGERPEDIEAVASRLDITPSDQFLFTRS